MTDMLRVNTDVVVDTNGTPTDVGWGWVRVVNGTVHRTCKGCGALAISPFDPATGMVAERPIVHKPGCEAFQMLVSAGGCGGA